MQCLPQPGDSGRYIIQVSVFFHSLKLTMYVMLYLFKDAMNQSTMGGRRPGGLGALRWRVFDEVTRNYSHK